MRLSTLKLIRDYWTPLLLSGLVVLLSFLLAFATPSIRFQATVMMINLVLVVGLYIFAGNSGVLSFGHISFVAVAAYVTAWLTIPPARKAVLIPELLDFLANTSMGSISAGLLAASASAVFAVVLAVPLMRLSGLTASLAMFAVLVVVREVGLHWVEMTRGTNTMMGLPSTVSLRSATAVAIIVIWFAYFFQESFIGLRLRASREDEPAAKAVGINIAKYRGIAFVISAFVVGIGGSQYAQFHAAFTPDAFFIDLTFLTIAMLVVGGLFSLSGAVLGTIVMSLLLGILRQMERGISIGPLEIVIPSGSGILVVGLLLLLMLALRKEGLTRGKEATWPATMSVLGRIAGATSWYRRPAKTPVDSIETPSGSTEEGQSGSTEEGQSGSTEEGQSGSTEEGQKLTSKTPPETPPA